MAINFGRMAAMAQGIGNRYDGAVLRGITNSLKANLAQGMPQQVAGDAWNMIAKMYGNQGLRVGAGVVGGYSAYASQKNFRRGRYGRGALWGSVAVGQGLFAWRGGSIAQKMAGGMAF